MIEVTMRVPRMTPGMISNTLAFSEPHWSAAKELIRELEALGWTFVRMAASPPDDKPWGLAIEGFAYDLDGPVPKPPFDPLKAGWVSCGNCEGKGYYLQFVGKNQEILSSKPMPCPLCDGLGIVVGPPRDGVRVAHVFAVAHHLGLHVHPSVYQGLR